MEYRTEFDSKGLEKKMKGKLLCMLSGSALLLSAADVKITLENDRNNPVYPVGAEIVFRISAELDGREMTAGELEYRVWGIDGQPSPLRSLAAKDKMEIRCKGDAPGFIQAGVRPKGSKRDFAYAGAAVEPEKIRVSRPVPADFDSFWAEQLKVIRNVPFEVELRDVSPERLIDAKRIVCREVFIRSRSGLTASGFLAYPADAERKTLPIIATFNGASKVVADARTAQYASRNPALAFNLNFHGLDNQLAQPEIRKRMAELKGYQYRNADNPERYPMRNIFLRVLLSLDYLKSLPQWDGKRIIVRGGSLGACQALVAAALDPQVTLCVAGAAAMCDHTGKPAGWPGLLAQKPEAEKIAPYFDAANFASRIRCRTVMSVGFIDRTCPPASTYAAYHNIPHSNKKMYHVVKGDHNGNSPDKKGVYWYGYNEIRRLCTEKGK